MSLILVVRKLWVSEMLHLYWCSTLCYICYFGIFGKKLLLFVIGLFEVIIVKLSDRGV